MGCIVPVRGVKSWTSQRYTVEYSPFLISGKPNKSAAMDLKTNPLLAQTGSLLTNLRLSPGVSKADGSSASPLTKLTSALTLTSCHLDSRVSYQNTRCASAYDCRCIPYIQKNIQKNSDSKISKVHCNFI